MKMTKKVLGVVIALAMLVNVFAMFSFALAPDSAVDLYLTTDKDSYKAGDTVTFTVSMQFIEAVGQVRVGATLPVVYDSSKIQFAKTVDVVDDPAGNFNLVAHQGGYDNSLSSVTWTEDNLTMGDAIDEGHGWDSLVYLCLADDNGETTFDAFEKTDFYSFEMVIAEDCPDGDFVVGLNKNSFELGGGYVLDAAMGGIYAEDEQFYGTTKNYSLDNAVVTIHVGEDVVDSSIVKFGGNQIRFNGIGADGNGVYDKTFDIRTVATIDEADFFALFGADNAADADAVAIANITAVGFVYTTGEYNEADAKAAAGTGASGAYVDAQVKYIQHTDGAYRFTCLTKGIGEADKDQSMTVLGYIKVGDNVAFFDAAQFVDFTEVYNNGLTNLKAVNPGFNPEA